MIRSLAGKPGSSPSSPQLSDTGEVWGGGSSGQPTPLSTPDTPGSGHPALPPHTQQITVPVLIPGNKVTHTQRISLLFLLKSILFLL